MIAQALILLSLTATPYHWSCFLQSAKAIIPCRSDNITTFNNNVPLRFTLPLLFIHTILMASCLYYSNYNHNNVIVFFAFVI